MSDARLKCRLLWTLSRNHGWASPMSERAVVDRALASSDQGRGKEIVRDLAREPYVTYRRGRGYGLTNDPDAQAQAAYRLTDSCGYLEIQVEPTLSRFEQAGGFDEYERDAVLDELGEWD